MNNPKPQIWRGKGCIVTQLLQQWAVCWYNNDPKGLHSRTLTMTPEVTSWSTMKWPWGEAWPVQRAVMGSVKFNPMLSQLYSDWSDFIGLSIQTSFHACGNMKCFDRLHSTVHVYILCIYIKLELFLIGPICCAWVYITLMHASLWLFRITGRMKVWLTIFIVWIYHFKVEAYPAWVTSHSWHIFTEHMNMGSTHFVNLEYLFSSVGFFFLIKQMLFPFEKTTCKRIGEYTVGGTAQG